MEAEATAADMSDEDVDFLVGASRSAIAAGVVAGADAVVDGGTSESDVDLLAGARRAAAPFGPGSMVAAIGTREGRDQGAQLAALAPTGSSGPPSKFGTGPMQLRTRAQKELLACNARASRAAKRVKRVVEEHGELVTRAVEAIQEHALVRKGRAVQTVHRPGRFCKGKVRVPQLHVVVRGEQLGRKARLAVPAILDICYDMPSMSLRNIGHVFHIDPRYVPRLQCLTAGVVLERQADMCAALAEQSGRTAPLFYVSTLAFDETTEKLALPMVTLPNQSVMHNIARSAWHVLVSRQEITLAHQVGEGIVVRHKRICRPTVPLVSTGAGACYDGLFKVRPVARIAAADATLAAEAEVSVFHTDRDGAFSNDKLILHRNKQLDPKILASDMTCGNHRTQLIEVAAAASVGEHIIPSLYRRTQRRSHTSTRTDNPPPPTPAPTPSSLQIAASPCRSGKAWWPRPSIRASSLRFAGWSSSSGWAATGCGACLQWSRWWRTTWTSSGASLFSHARCGAKLSTT